MAAASAGWSKSKMRETLITAAGNMLLKLNDRYLHPGKDAGVKSYRKFMLPLEPESAKVAAGLFLKFSMREMLLAAHRENAIKGFPEYRWGDRTALYKRLDKVTFREYAYDILAPCYPGKTPEQLLAESHLKSIEKTLRTSPKIRVFHTVDDFLVSDSERVWLDNTLKERICWFSNGSHLGNLYYPQLLDAIINAAE